VSKLSRAGGRVTGAEYESAGPAGSPKVGVMSSAGRISGITPNDTMCGRGDSGTCYEQDDRVRCGERQG
jgi:hypothetical protein